MSLELSIFTFTVLAATTATPAPAAQVVQEVRPHRTAHEREILGELAGFLRLPNVWNEAKDADVRANAAHLLHVLERRGIASRLLEAPSSPPAVFGELKSPGATRTVVFYAHYDGQPVDPAAWATPPWEPTLRTGPLESGGSPIDWAHASLPLDPEARLYARSASDDKAPIVALLAALDALRASGRAPAVNVKLFFEGGEEAGSPHLGELLRRHAEALRADAWLFLDGPVHQTRRPQIVFGVRGTMGLELTLYGPSRALHSGHYGNWAPNPAALLTHLLAGLRSPDGEILVPGFYDSTRPLSEADRAALAALPSPDADLRRELSLASTEAEGALLAERILRPALNLRGIAAGKVGEQAANAIPTEARASIDFRLVPDETPEEVRRLVEAHLVAKGYHLVHGEPTREERAAHVPRLVRLDWEGGYRAVRTPLDQPFARQVLAVATDAMGPEVLAVPALGGSLPLYHFADVFPEAALVIVPTVNHDNNQHAANENLRLQNLWDAVELFAALLVGLGESP